MYILFSVFLVYSVVDVLLPIRESVIDLAFGCQRLEDSKRSSQQGTFDRDIQDEQDYPAHPVIPSYFSLRTSDGPAGRSAAHLYGAAALLRRVNRPT